MDINASGNGVAGSLETDLTKVLLDQVASNNFLHIELRNYTEWLHSIKPEDMLKLFTAWGEYRGCIVANGARAQVHEIEGWIIDNLFLTPEENWWVWRNFLVDTTEYLDEPFTDTPLADIVRNIPWIEKHLMGAMLDYGKALREGALSIDNTNERLYVLYLTSIQNWVEWYIQNEHVMEMTSNAVDLKVLYNMLYDILTNHKGEPGEEE